MAKVTIQVLSCAQWVGEEYAVYVGETEDRLNCLREPYKSFSKAHRQEHKEQYPDEGDYLRFLKAIVRTELMINE